MGLTLFDSKNLAQAGVMNFQMLNEIQPAIAPRPGRV